MKTVAEVALARAPVIAGEKAQWLEARQFSAEGDVMFVHVEGLRRAGKHTPMSAQVADAGIGAQAAAASPEAAVKRQWLAALHVVVDGMCVKAQWFVAVHVVGVGIATLVQFCGAAPQAAAMV